jgi:hypothetical protein
MVFVVGNTLSNLNVAIPVRARKRHIRRKSTTALSLQEQDMIAVVSLSTLKDLQGSALIYDSLSSSSFWMVVHFFFFFFFSLSILTRTMLAFSIFNWMYVWLCGVIFIF